MRDHLQLHIINGSKVIANDKVYIFIKAQIVGVGKECLIRIDPRSGVGVSDIVNASTNIASYCYQLSSLPRTKDGHSFVYIPKVISGRMYVSVGRPMSFYLDLRTMRIPDPDGFRPRDPNYYTLYDKVEFTYNNGGTWINPTAVDFFSLPLRIEMPSASTPLKKAGISHGQSAVISSVRNQLNAHDKSGHKWNKLFLRANTVSEADSILRIVAPCKAMVQGVPGTVTFDVNYLTNKTGFNYTDFIWNYYKQNTVKFDCSELKNIIKLDNYIFVGKVNNRQQFVFRNETGTKEEVIDKPKTSIPFFAGTTESFNAQNGTPKAIIVRQLTAAFEVGLLPASSGTMLSRNFFMQNFSKYYNDNHILPKEALAKGPWYDLYSKALHSINSQEPIYTFAYDDALGQDGTLYDSKAGEPGPVFLTLGDLSGVKIPNPEYDPNKYQVTIQKPANLPVTYNGRSLAPSSQFSNVGMPMELVINNKAVKIYVHPAMVKPYSPAAEGIVINRQNLNVTLILPGVFGDFQLSKI